MYSSSMISPCVMSLPSAGDALTSERMAFLPPRSSWLRHHWVSQEIPDEKPHFKSPFTDLKSGEAVTPRSPHKLLSQPGLQHTGQDSPLLQRFTAAAELEELQP